MKEDIKQLLKFVESCTLENAAKIMQHIIKTHSVIAWDEQRLKEVDSANLNGLSIQINVQKY